MSAAKEWQKRYAAAVKSAKLHMRNAEKARARKDYVLAQQEESTARKAFVIAEAMLTTRPPGARIL